MALLYQGDTFLSPDPSTMTTKRKANVAFGNLVSDGPISAFAAARLARIAQQPKSVTLVNEHSPVFDTTDSATTAVATVLYDDRLDDDVSIDLQSAVQNVARTPPLHFSTHDASKVSRDSEAQFEVTLKAEQTVIAVGEYDFEVLEGSILLYGATLRPRGKIPGSSKHIPGSGKHRVYAPSISALPQIIAKRDGTMIRIETIQSGLNDLGKISPLFRNIGSGNALRSFTILRTSRDIPDQRTLSLLESDKVSSSLLHALSSRSQLRDKQCTLIVGAKSTGKSTFNRMLCNSILTMNPDSRCCYLDLDPGQPEFGPPGQVTLVEVKGLLLGPTFSHPASGESHCFRLLRSHTIAATSFKDNPSHYLACVKDLVQFSSRRALNDVPLIVNSCGWLNGIGANVLMNVVSLLSSHSIDLVTLGIVDPSLVATMQSISNTTEIHELPKRVTRFSVRTPVELRGMQSIAYFHHYGDKKGGPQLAWESEPVDTLWPYNVAYDGVSPDILAILSYGSSPDPVHLAEVLDGAIVALVKVTTQAFGEESLPQNEIGQTFSHGWPSSASILRTSEGLPYLKADPITPLDPVHSECLGLALVRGIDMRSKCLLLVTPIPQARLLTAQNERIVLVRGSFDPPEWAYLENMHFNDESGSRGGEIDVEDKPWVSRKEMVGIESAVWRLRHPPMASAIIKQ